MIEDKIDSFLNEGEEAARRFDETNKVKKAKMIWDTSPFERSHMKKPGGRGSWAFNIGFELLKAKKHLGAAQKKGFIYLSPSMTYIEAKKWFTDLVSAEKPGKTVYVDVEP